jgi:hypothetical protein
MFYDELTVPKDPRENVRWRLNLWKAAATSRSLQRDILRISAADCLWWINSFCWLYEPRAGTSSRFIPFVTWPHQDALVAGINKCIDFSLQDAENKIDFGVEKSRGEGATWSYLMTALWRWIFEPMFACGLISRNEDCVDGANPDALMPKLDWQLRQLPRWMWPDGFSFREHRRTKDHSLMNPEMESTIVGFPATGDAGAGGRKTIFLMDELGRFKVNESWLAMSSTQYVADCRGLVSTYRGEEGAFYAMMQGAAEIEKYTMYWWDNPTRNRLLYKYTRGRTEAVRPGQQAALREYEAKNKKSLDRLRKAGYFQEGQMRSPWYDNECKRASSPQFIAEELDCNPATRRRSSKSSSTGPSWPS